MRRIDPTKIGKIWRDRSFQMTIFYIVLAVMLAFIATSKPQLGYLFWMVPVALICAGVMTWVFIHNTDAIIIYGDNRDERMRADHILAERVEEVIAGLELTQTGFSIGGGWNTHIPRVVKVATGSPMELYIHTLPGQTSDNFAAHAPAIAKNLGVLEVQVVSLGPSLIRLDLLQHSKQPQG